MLGYFYNVINGLSDNAAIDCIIELVELLEADEIVRMNPEFFGRAMARTKIPVEHWTIIEAHFIHGKPRADCIRGTGQTSAWMSKACASVLVKYMDELKRAGLTVIDSYISDIKDKEAFLTLEKTTVEKRLETLPKIRSQTKKGNTPGSTT